jgi:phosphoglycolate phosphatase-like HAD superfamily hydrolase
VVAQQPGDGPTKAEAVRGHVEAAARTTWIGDTEVDIEGARLLGCRSIAVTCGIRDEAQLRMQQPAEIVADLASAIAVTQHSAW